MTAPTNEALRLGTRGSALARWQANWVAERLAERGVAVEPVLITTGGDINQGPLRSVGEQGLFTKEIQRALLEDRIDLAVHSLKDLPTEVVPGLVLAAVPPRERVFDALVSSARQPLAELPAGSRIGTGSVRRKAQLLAHRPDLQVADIRGNVDTRLRKLADGEFDAIVLAEAGLRRLGWTAQITEVLPPEIMLPAVGQGALGIECRADDQRARAVLAGLNDADAYHSVLAERALLATLRGGCLAPVAAWGRVARGLLTLDAVVLSSDGRQRLSEAGAGAGTEAAAIGRSVAEQLLQQGAAELLDDARRGEPGA